MSNLKNIVTAKHSGFCYGVKRAVETTKNLKRENNSAKVWVLGELIHNSHVIEELSQLGINTVDELPCGETGICIIRSHGASPEVIKSATEKGFEIVDLTCPDVKKVQQRAIELAKDDYLVIIVGKPEHPEVVAINANAKQFGENVFVVPDIKTLKTIEEKIKEHKKIGVVVQTTQKIETLNEILCYLTTIAKEIKIFNTICKSTQMRQKEARDLAEVSDLMVVVGSKKSANTTHLAEILREITTTIHIETDEELSKYADLIKKSQNIAITAGASTPDDIIQKVHDKLSIY
ncbi:MAG: 4-hydroxy-3-methylbut-2-enyl diphosphate reductase [Candidatus Gastranaerophilaceae bacterium]